MHGPLVLQSGLEKRTFLSTKLCKVGKARHYSCLNSLQIRSHGISPRTTKHLSYTNSPLRQFINCISRIGINVSDWVFTGCRVNVENNQKSCFRAWSTNKSSALYRSGLSSYIIRLDSTLWSSDDSLGSWVLDRICAQFLNSDELLFVEITRVDHIITSRPTVIGSCWMIMYRVIAPTK